MLAETIYLKDVLQQMKTPDKDGQAVPFAIKVRTLNRYSKKGGKLNSYTEARLVMKEKQERITSVEALRTMQPKVLKERKNPHHFQNKTRNIRLSNGERKKIHIRFIIEFNNKKVIY
ncbi:hypothetical protein [Tenacibaculum soleae]|uniref:hypothetical protein n=1 Tax=Tenacibaculum soleae TaxID=447689 RepID=UPI0026E3E6F0|nr:hypothetical protein [Tenacibaculum soleae]MDO6813824.1 hypothetical protein [Tenacibaculum soleae]